MKWIAVADSEFFHPRFLLLGNIEDKGMELARSYNFQKVIVEQSDARAQRLPTMGALKTSLRRVVGNWHTGLVLDKHSVSSTFTGYSESGRKQFDTVRTDVGEATFQLKYRADWAKVPILAREIADSICPQLAKIGFVLPMPASNQRLRQPVTEVARSLAEMIQVPVFENLLLKTYNGQSLKDLHTKEEKMAALSGSFSINDEITNEGKWNVLLIDDLYHTGASAEAACTALGSYRKINQIYFAALTWR